MRIGNLRHRMTVERQVSVGDDFDHGDQRWEKLAEVVASYETLRGAELVAAQQIRSETTMKVSMRWSRKLSDITSRDRIQFGEKLLDIVSVSNVDGRNRWLELQVVEHGKA